MGPVLEANQSLRSALNPWIRKLRQPRGMTGIDRPIAEATDSLQTKN